MKKNKTRPELFVTHAVAAAVAWVMLSGADAARAENPQIDNVTVTQRDAQTAQVRFDLNWPNALRLGMRHDAVWVFFKARAGDGTEWRHPRLVADRVLSPSGFGQGAGTPLEFVVPDGKDGFTGMFLRRAGDGKGTVTASTITAVISLEPLNTNLLVFAIEMAYVPEGPFELGSSDGVELNRLCAYTGQDISPPMRVGTSGIYHDFAENTPPYRVTGPGAIPTGRQPGRLWAAGITPEDGGEIPASFPNGYAAFYGMKRFITQGQYAAFLNTLTEAQAEQRFYAEGHGPEITRSDGRSNGTYTASVPGARCPWLSWADGAAFAAWAGLRPMTELEYEKAGSEIPETGHGGVYDRAVSIGSAMGRTFAGTHGDGTPGVPEDWPKDLSGVVFRGDVLHAAPMNGRHLAKAGRVSAPYAHADRNVWPFPGWRAARSAAAGDTGLQPDPAHRAVARLAKALRADGVLDEWTKPVAVLSDPDDIFPDRFRLPPPADAGPDAAFWQGPQDLGAKLYLGWDGDTLCVAGEVTDDKHFNAYATQNIASGDALQIGIVIGEGVRWNFGLALTKTGVAFHQWEGAGDALAKTANLAAVRDDAGGVTRYELRLPLEALGLKPGGAFGFNAVVFDDDDGFGQCYRVQMGPDLRFVLAE
ncbi:MAG: hypothetical protein FJ222_04380 [Lentisphaerae bacterium]|nr:hypothetical protein [Lentisphaerota bacterium]